MSTSLSLQFKEELEKTYADIRSGLFEVYGPDILHRLLIPPYWTLETLGTLFPRIDCETFFAQAHYLGLGKIEKDGQWLSIDTVGRHEAIRIIGGDAVQRLAAYLLQDTASKINGAIKASSNPNNIPEVLADWATLAQLAPSNVVSRLITNSDDESLDDRLIAAASPIAELMGGECAAAVAQLKRRQLRRVVDFRERRALACFLPRAQQIDAVNSLLAPGTREWALHVIGHGGFGKTMLVRHVVTELAPARGYAAARIDFDLLSPDFPVIEPGQLLLALARDLQDRYGLVSTDSSYSRVAYESASTQEISGLEHWDVSPRGREEATKDPLGFVRSDQFRRLLYAFQDFLESLQMPVLLVLDTCEELARLRLGAEKLPQVEAMLAILEAVQRMVPSVRVLFAGRRYLAQGGARWTANTPDRKALPEVRPYLCLHEVKPFDQVEAMNYLFDKRHLDKFKVGKNSAICKRLLEVCRDPKTNGYNPFDLNLYTSWLTDDPKAAAQILDRSDIDPYVNTRILGRIDDPDVKKAVYALIVLGQANRAFLIGSLALPEARAHVVEAELVNLEWVDTSPEAGTLSISPRLATRLKHYFRQFMVTERNQTERRLRSHLQSLMDDDGFQDADKFTIGAAAQLLEAPTFGRLWDQLCEQFTREGNREGLQNIAAYLLDDDGGTPLVGPHHRCRSGVLADYAAVIDPSSPEYESAWTEVHDLADKYPTDRRQSLRLTAVNALSVLGEGVLTADILIDPLAELTAEGDDHLMSSQVNAVEALLDKRLRMGTLARKQAKRIAAWANRIEDSHPLKLPALLCSVRALMLSNQIDEAKHESDRLLDRISRAKPISSLSLWTAPQDFMSLTLLHLALGIPDFLLLSNSSSSPKSHKAVSNAILRSSDSMEGDRLASLWIAMRSNRAIYATMLSDSERFSKTTFWGLHDSKLPVASLVPPLYVSIGRDICRHGGIVEAMQYCDSIDRILGHAETDERLWITKLQFEFIGSCRSRRYLEVLQQNLSRRESHSTKNLRWLSILTGEPIDGDLLPRDSWHERFSTEFAPVPEAYHGHYQPSNRRKEAPAIRHEELDQFEIDLLNPKAKDIRVPKPWNSRAYVEKHLYRADEVANVVWRRFGLGVGDEDLDYWQDLVGYVRFAEIGCEEALLVARRLPQVAHRILRQVFEHLGNVNEYPSVLRMLGKNAHANPSRFLADLARVDNPYRAMQILGYAVEDPATQPKPTRKALTKSASARAPDIFITSTSQAEFTESWGSTIVVGGEQHNMIIPSIMEIAPQNLRSTKNLRKQIRTALSGPGNSEEGLPIVANALHSAWPWEAIFPQLVRVRSSRLTHRIVREVVGSSIPGPILVGAADARFASQQWAPELNLALGKAPRTPFVSVLPSKMPSFSLSYRILHLVGRGDQTFKEFRLLFPDESPSKADIGQTNSLGLRSRDIPASACQLIIVQGEPSLDFRRGNSNLIDTASLRGFAAELSAAGARFVLMIPSMPKLASALVVARISHEFGARRASITRISLLNLIQDLQSQIPDHDWTQEALREITLFVNEN
ncbi:MAG: AAA family ATPase [Armatimonadetes bacterium]|nr:AAA family ATPase [Armatimonadota bacterium]